MGGAAAAGKRSRLEGSKTGVSCPLPGEEGSENRMAAAFAPMGVTGELKQATESEPTGDGTVLVSPKPPGAERGAAGETVEASTLVTPTRHEGGERGEGWPHPKAGGPRKSVLSSPVPSKAAGEERHEASVSPRPREPESNPGSRPAGERAASVPPLPSGGERVAGGRAAGPPTSEVSAPLDRGKRGGNSARTGEGESECSAAALTGLARLTDGP